MIHVKQELTQLAKPSKGRNWFQIPYIMGLEKTKSNSMSSASYLISDKPILKCQGHLGVKLYLFERILGALGTICRN